MGPLSLGLRLHRSPNNIIHIPRDNDVHKWRVRECGRTALRYINHVANCPTEGKSSGYQQRAWQS